jgi:hypothetical protein
MLGETVLDRVSSINDLGIIMDEKMTFSEHVDVMVAKAFAMLGFIRRLSLEFRGDFRFMMERVQRRFIRYALLGLGWTDMHDLPPYEDRCILLYLDTLWKRRSIACVMFIFDVLSGRVNSSNLLSVAFFMYTNLVLSEGLKLSINIDLRLKSVDNK